MSIEATRQVVNGYLSDLGGHWFSHDVRFLDVADPPVRIGRPAAVQAVGRFFAGGLFASPRRDDLALIVADGRAAAEWIFHARHVGSLYGEAPTGRNVTAPMAVLFDVVGGEITRAHLFYDGVQLQRQVASDRCYDSDTSERNPETPNQEDIPDGGSPGSADTRGSSLSTGS